MFSEGMRIPKNAKNMDFLKEFYGTNPLMLLIQTILHSVAKHFKNNN